MSTQPQSKASRIELALAVLALAICAWFCACILNESRDKAADDAFITYTYGRNLAEGHGLRYNASDAAPTAGASSLLHVLLIALERHDAPLLLTRDFSLLSVLTMAVVLGWIGARLVKAPVISGVLAGAAVMIVLALLPETEVHLASGMETLLFTTVHALAAATAATIVFDQRERFRVLHSVCVTFVFALLVIARPEGSALALGYMTAIVIARASPTPGIAARLKRLAPIWLPVVLVVAGSFVWTKAYFGDVFANPYYVKSHNAIFGSDGAILPGLETTLRVMLLRVVPLAAVAAVLAVAGGAPREVIRKSLWLLAPSIAIVVLYAHVIHEMAGGFRYEYPMLAPLLGAIVVGLCALRRRSGKQFGATVALFAVAMPLLISPISESLPIWLAYPRSKSTLWMAEQVPQNNALERLGLDLRDTGLGQDASIVLSAAGQIPWHSRLRAIDWIGLNNNEFCGREAFSVEELWRRIEQQHPDVVMSILPPATAGAIDASKDPNFASGNVKRTLGGRGSALFEHWNRARVAESFWREMCFIRDGYEFGACYKMGLAWGDDWWTFAYVRRDSPQREKLLEVLSKSTRADRTSDLSKVFPSDPRKLGSR